MNNFRGKLVLAEKLPLILGVIKKNVPL